MENRCNVTMAGRFRRDHGYAYNMELNRAQRAAVNRAGDVKEKLVEFATSPHLASRLRRFTRENSPPPHGLPPEDVAVLAVDSFIFDMQFDDGSTLIDRFLARSDATEADAAMARGFLHGYSSIFEVTTDTPAAPDVFEVRCCGSDLHLRLAPTLPQGVGALRLGSFLQGRLNPIAGTDLWTASGPLITLPASSRKAVSEIVQSNLMVPSVNHRNPDYRDRALQIQHGVHERFLAQHGIDQVVVRQADLLDVWAKAMTPPDISPEGQDSIRQALYASLAGSPMWESDDILAHSDPVSGVTFYAEFSSVDRALCAGASATAQDLEILRGYLEDESIPQWLVRRIVTDRLPTSEAALALTLGDSKFSWAADGAAFLAGLPGEVEPVLSHVIAPLIVKEYA